MDSNKRVNKYHVVVLLTAAVVLPGKDSNAQYGIQTYQCVGNIGGLQSAAALQIEPGGYRGGPYIAGQIQNRTFAYTFTGELFGGSEGFVSLVEMSSGERIDRVWIGLNPQGFTLAPEAGPRYVFNCQR